MKYALVLLYNNWNDDTFITKSPNEWAGRRALFAWGHQNYIMKDEPLATLTKVCACALMSASAVTLCKNLETGVRGPRPVFHLFALLPPFKFTIVTSWKQLIFYGTSSGLIASSSFHEGAFFDVLLSKFAQERAIVSLGRRYRSGPKYCGQKSIISTEDILGFIFWRLKYSARQTLSGPVFGFVPSSLIVWLEYELRALYRMLKRRDCQDFRMMWPTVEEME